VRGDLSRSGRFDALVVVSGGELSKPAAQSAVCLFLSASLE
jgi:hypothetical protein